ncbi:hypothetical protein OROGR_004466 [Orobanche gracilis]
MKSLQHILPPPPSEIPPNVVPIQIGPNKSSSSISLDLVPKMIVNSTPRPVGSKGKRVSLRTNHFKVTISSDIGDFYHYDVLITYEDGLEVTRKNTKMVVIEKLCETYKSELDGKTLVYDGDRSVFTLGRLPQNNLQFSVVLTLIPAKGINGNDRKRQRLASRSTLFIARMQFVSAISMKSLDDAKCGKRIVDYCSGFLRVLNVIIQQRSLKRGCLVVGQSVYRNDPSNFIDLGGGILGCRGLFSSFRALQSGLYLNHDVSVTTIIQPGSVVDFLVKNQNVKTPFNIKWNEASTILKNLRIKVKHLHSEFKISGLSAKSCKEQKFSFKLGEAREGGSMIRSIETTVYDYFVSTRGIELSFSANLPCINAGKPSKPVFFPIEVYVLCGACTEEQARINCLSKIKSRQKPEDFIKVLDDDVKRFKLEDEPLFQSCGISISNSFVQAEGRILTPPKLVLGNGEHIIPKNGWWNIKDKKFVEPTRLENWAIVKFSTCCDVKKMCQELAKISSAKGMVINPPSCVLEENPKHRKKPPSLRVEMMFQQIFSRFRNNPPQFILCLLADKKFSDLYGPWKRKTIIEFGILDQCISSSKIDEHYIMNILLKINAKLGGLNHTVSSELTRTIPLVSKIPTMILGMEVSHAPPGRTNAPSIASVVGSRRELLMEFYSSSGQKKPAQIVIFRNGLSTSQFKQMLEVELDQILKACTFLEEKWRPKFTVLVSQRRHHTKFFDAISGANVTPGTIVDSKVCDLECTNFYMCAHAARIGTLRPTHYHVLLNEIGFSLDDIQELINSLSYVFQRSNNAISEVAPVRYARLAAAKISQVIEHDKMPNVIKVLNPLSFLWTKESTQSEAIELLSNVKEPASTEKKFSDLRKPLYAAALK